MPVRKFLTQELAACAEREVRMRRRVYPRWVELGRMREDEAQRELEMMEEIAAKLAAESEQGALF